MLFLGRFCHGERTGTIATIVTMTMSVKKSVMAVLFGIVWIPALLGLPVDPKFSDQEKIQQRQRGESLCRDLRAAIAKGDKEFVIPAGEYRLMGTGPQKYVLTFKGLKDFSIRGEGEVRFWMEDFSGVFDFQDCERVAVSNLVVDYDPLRLIQGKIVDIDPVDNTLILAEEEGYGYARLAGKILDHGWLSLHDPQTRRLKNGSRMPEVKFKPLPGGRLAAQINLPAKEIRAAKGDVVAIRPAVRSGSGAALRLLSCAAMKFDKIIFNASPQFTLYERYSRGTSYFTECEIVRPSESTRLGSSIADGFHSTMGIHGPVFERCVVEGSGDDAFNIHGNFSFVMKQMEPKRVRVAPLLTRDFNVGDRIDFYQYPQFKHLGSGKVVSYTSSTDPELLKEARSYKEKVAAVPGGRIMQMKSEEVLDVEIDKAVALDGLVLVCSSTYHGNGAKILNCRVENVRGRGLISSSSDVVISGNRISWTSGPAMEISADLPWMQGAFNDNITVRDNVIENVFLGGDSCAPYKTAMGAISVHIYTATLAPETPQRNIRIENNSITNTRAAGIAVQNAENVTIIGNRLSHTNEGEIWQLGKALGLNPRFAILLAVVKNPVVKDNVIETPLPPGVGEIGIDQPLEPKP